MASLCGKSRFIVPREMGTADINVRLDAERFLWDFIFYFFPMDIENWRKKIDELENTLIGLLNRRAEYAVEIGKIKKSQGLPVLDASREQEILFRVAQKAEVQKGPLSPESMRRIFQVIMAETRQVEK